MRQDLSKISVNLIDRKIYKMEKKSLMLSELFNWKWKKYRKSELDVKNKKNTKDWQTPLHLLYQKHYRTMGVKSVAK